MRQMQTTASRPSLSNRPLFSEKRGLLPTTNILRQLGAIGLESVEPIIFAALANRDPLLLIGPHGCGKSWLLNLIAAALGIEQRHYNASLLNFDDLVRYPLPDTNGQTAMHSNSSVDLGRRRWYSSMISRCRPEIQNKLFSIIQEKRLRIIPLERSRHRWWVMNHLAARRTLQPMPDPTRIDHADRFACTSEIPTYRLWSKTSAG
jgi:MoxR-like ATPase